MPAFTHANACESMSAHAPKAAAACIPKGGQQAAQQAVQLAHVTKTHSISTHHAAQHQQNPILPILCSDCSDEAGLCTAGAGVELEKSTQEASQAGSREAELVVG